MKRICLLLFLFSTIIFCQSVGDFRSKTSGNWGETSTWETYNGTSWVNASSLPTSSNNVTILGTHVVTLEYNLSTRACKNLTVDSGGKLWANSTTSRTLFVWGDILCNGDIGNGEIIDAISFGISGATCNISGSGSFNARSLFKSQTANTITDLVIDMDINLRTNNATQLIRNSAANTLFNITINTGKKLYVSANTQYYGDIRLDFGVETGGTITVNGNLEIYGSLINYTDNTTNGVSLIINPGGNVKTKYLDWTNASGSAGSTINVKNAAALEITDIVWYNNTNNTLVNESGSTVIYSSSSSQNIINTTYHNLSIKGVGTKTLIGNTTVNGTLSREYGSLSLGSYSLTYGTDASLVYTGSATTSSEWPSVFDKNVTVNAGAEVTLNENKTINNSTLTVNGQLNTVSGSNAYKIYGNGNFILNSGGTLKIGSAEGISSSGAFGSIQITGSRTFSSSANYYYYNEGSNDVYTGSGLPSSVNSIYMDIHSAYKLFLTNNLTVNNYFYYKKGNFDKNGNTYLLGDDATIQYENTTNVTAGEEWPDNTNADVNIFCGWSYHVLLYSRTLNGNLNISSSGKLLIYSDQTLIVNGNITNNGYLDGNNQGSTLQFCGSTFNANSSNNRFGILKFYGNGTQTITSISNISYFLEIKIGSSSNTTFTGTQSLINPSGNEKITIESGGKLIIDGDITINVPIYAYGTIEIQKNSNLYLNDHGRLYLYNNPVTGSGTLNANSSYCIISVQNNNYLTSSTTNFDILSGKTYLDGGPKLGGQLKVHSGATLELAANQIIQCDYNVINEGTITGHVGCGIDFKGENFNASSSTGLGILNFTRLGTQTISGLRHFSQSIYEINICNGSNVLINEDDTLTLATTSKFEIKSGGTLTVPKNFTIYGLVGCSSVADKRCGIFRNSGQITINGCLWLCLGTVEMLGNRINGNGKIKIGQEASNFADFTDLTAADLADTNVTFEVPSGCAVNIDRNSFSTRGPSIIAGRFKMIGCVETNGSARFYGFLTISSGGGFYGMTISIYDMNDCYQVFAYGGCSNSASPCKIVLRGNAQQSMSGDFKSVEIDSNATVTLSNNSNVETLKLSSGILSTGENTLTIGSGLDNVGSLQIGNGHVVGNLKRWFNPSTSNQIQIPIGTENHYRPVNINFTSTPTQGGTITAKFISSNPGTLGLPLNDDGTQITNVGSNGYWVITTADGLEGGTYNLDLTAAGFSGINDYSSLRILKRNDNSSPWTLSGIHVSGTGTNENPVLHRNGLTSFSEFGVGGTSENPLPVELKSFSASIVKNDVVLNWQTATEVNNYGFEIERAFIEPVEMNDASTSSASKWEKIGFVTGHGNSNSPKDYSFIDENPKSGKNKYRLKQIDFDGKYEYSEVVEVTIDLPTKFALEQNYPNPFNPTTTILYSIPSVMVRLRQMTDHHDNVTLRQAQCDIEVTLKVFDMLGREVATLVNEKQSPGNYEVKFDASNLSSGIYFYKLQAGNFNSTKKLLLLK